jgi:hypothetical protein
MISFSRYAAGAADGYMNDSLSHEQRTMFLHAYNKYDKKASAMLERAVFEVDGKYMKGESFDVVPLCVATLLYHAAGVSYNLLKRGWEESNHMIIQACMKGCLDIDKAAAAFGYYNTIACQARTYNQFPNKFPIVMRHAPNSSGAWAVDLLVSLCISSDGIHSDLAAGRRRTRSRYENGLDCYEN